MNSDRYITIDSDDEESRKDVLGAAWFNLPRELKVVHQGRTMQSMRTLRNISEAKSWEADQGEDKDIVNHLYDLMQSRLPEEFFASHEKLSIGGEVITI